jgi:hypothetical protein
MAKRKKEEPKIVDPTILKEEHKENWFIYKANIKTEEVYWLCCNHKKTMHNLANKIKQDLNFKVKGPFLYQHKNKPDAINYEEFEKL